MTLLNGTPESCCLGAYRGCRYYSMRSTAAMTTLSWSR